MVDAEVGHANKCITYISTSEVNLRHTHTHVLSQLQTHLPFSSVLTIAVEVHLPLFS